MSIWANAGQLIGQSFNEGFTRGFNQAQDDKRKLEMAMAEQRLKEEALQRERDRQSREMSLFLQNIVNNDRLVKDARNTPARAIPNEYNIFSQPVNSSYLQEPQANPSNSNNFRLPFTNQGSSAILGNTLEQDNAIKNARKEAITKQFGSGVGLLYDAVNSGNYPAVKFLEGELDKYFNPAKPVTTYRDYFDENKKAYMRQELIDGQPVGEPYMIKPYVSEEDRMRWKSLYDRGSGSNKHRIETITNDNGVEIKVAMDNQGDIHRNYGVTENARKNFRTEQIENGKDPDDVALAEQALAISRDKSFAIDVLNGRYNPVEIIEGWLFDDKIDLAEELEHYNVEKGNHTKGNGDVVKLLNNYVNQIVRDIKVYGPKVINLVPEEMKNNEKFIQMVRARLKNNDSNNNTAVAQNKTPVNKKEVNVDWQ